MNENELKLLWQTANEKIELSIATNKKNTDDITKLQVQYLVFSMKPLKIFTLIAGVLWVVALGIIIVNLFFNAYNQVSLFFLCSATIQLLLTAIAIAIYVAQLYLIHQTDFSQPVLQIQGKLSKLKTSTLNVTRLLFLQLPVWTTFYLSENIFTNGDFILLIVQGIITLSFTFIAIWLFVNIKYENRDKRWFQLIFNGKEWQPILQSMELLDQVEKYQDTNQK